MSIGMYHSIDIGNFTVSMGVHEEPFADTDYVVTVEDWSAEDDPVVEEITCKDEAQMVSVYRDMVHKYKYALFE